MPDRLFVASIWNSQEGMRTADLLQKRFPQLDAREAGLIVYAQILKILFGPEGLPPYEPL